jgi:hypothetical protein
MHAFAQGLVSHTQGEGNDPHDSAVPACGLGESGADGPRIHIYIYMYQYVYIYAVLPSHLKYVGAVFGVSFS